MTTGEILIEIETQLRIQDVRLRMLYNRDLGGAKYLLDEALSHLYRATNNVNNVAVQIIAQEEKGPR